jgi:IS1 family transposase
VQTEDQKPKGYGEETGDAYCFVAFERNTKLVAAWHLGHRTAEDTEAFTEKLAQATDGLFQLSTDGFEAYPNGVSYSLGTRVNFAQIIKTYRAAHPSQSPEGERRYSSSQVLEVVKVERIGAPDPALICTSHVERQNLTMRMSLRRLTRLTNTFSKKWSNLKAALALHFAYYNFCRYYGSIRCTPAMAAGVTKRVWEVEDLLTYYGFAFALALKTVVSTRCLLALLVPMQAQTVIRSRNRGGWRVGELLPPSKFSATHYYPATSYIAF